MVLVFEEEVIRVRCAYLLKWEDRIMIRINFTMKWLVSEIHKTLVK